MREIITFSLLLFLFLNPLYGQSETVSIDTALTRGANAVITEHHISYDVQSATNIQKRVKYKAVVLNQSGRDHGIFAVNIGTDEKITDFSGEIIKADGSVLTKIKKSDLRDNPSYADLVFLSDNRLYYYGPVIQDYPYSVEFDYTISYSGLLTFDPWTPVYADLLSCDTSSYTITCPAGYKLIYKSFNLDHDPVTSVDGQGRKTITWSSGPVYAVKEVNYEPPFETFMPVLYVKPEDFYYDGISGHATDWKSFGAWLSGLQKGRHEITPELKEKMLSLTAGLTDTRSKVERIYRYLQTNTRYVAIAFGIGGRQPAPAIEVEKYGYGDCKGLSNYMQALLASVGISSYYTIIGNEDVQIRYTDFPDFQTNHAILCVPNNNDTIWLECTSSFYKAGYLGYSNSNRKALLVTPEGGILVNTPRADSTNNFSRNRYNLKLDHKGASTYNINTNCTGSYYEELLYLNYLRHDLALKVLYSELPFSNHSISSFSVDIDSTQDATLTARIDGKFNKYATIAGKRLIVPLIPDRLFGNVPSFRDDRKAGFNISEHIALTDTVTIEIPAGYKFTIPNEPLAFSNEIGHYSQTVSSSGNSITVIRKVNMPAAIYPVEMKDKITEFFRQCHDIEAKRVMCELTL